MHSHASLNKVSAKPAAYFPYCKSFARFFCNVVWNHCKPAVFLPYCQSLARVLCNVVNIHRHRPIAWFICNDSCFCAIWPYFEYRYRPNGEFLCNDRSYEELPAHLGSPVHRCHLESSVHSNLQSDACVAYDRSRVSAHFVSPPHVHHSFRQTGS